MERELTREVENGPFFAFRSDALAFVGVLIFFIYSACKLLCFPSLVIILGFIGAVIFSE